MNPIIRIGTRESELAVWQATQVKKLLYSSGVSSELVFIKSEGDIDLKTPLYEIGVQGVFTRSLDSALLNNKIDIAVHSMKDVPVQLPKGILQAAILKRGSYKDLFLFHPEWIKKELPTVSRNTDWLDQLLANHHTLPAIATSSIRRKTQWINRYPNHTIENLRGNVNTRLKKLKESQWAGAIFAAAGLERIGLRPEHSIELDWMLPAPAQGAIMIVARENDKRTFDACHAFNDTDTALCTKIERDFLKVLLGGCSTPISALATVSGEDILFKGNILSLDGKEKVTIEKSAPIYLANDLGKTAAEELLNNGGEKIVRKIRNATI